MIILRISTNWMLALRWRSKPIKIEKSKGGIEINEAVSMSFIFINRPYSGNYNSIKEDCFQF